MGNPRERPQQFFVFINIFLMPADVLKLVTLVWGCLKVESLILAWNLICITICTGKSPSPWHSVTVSIINVESRRNKSNNKQGRVDIFLFIGSDCECWSAVCSAALLSGLLHHIFSNNSKWRRLTIFSATYLLPVDFFPVVFMSLVMRKGSSSLI